MHLINTYPSRKHHKCLYAQYIGSSLATADEFFNCPFIIRNYKQTHHITDYCQHLKIFRYTITNVAYNAIFVTSYIVTENLEEFYIRNSETVSDEMLRDLMAYGGNLR